MKKFTEMSGSEREQAILKLVTDAAEDGVDQGGRTAELVQLLTTVATASFSLMDQHAAPKTRTLYVKHLMAARFDLEEFLTKNLTEYSYA